MLWRNTMISKQHPVMKTPKLFWKKWWWKWHKSRTFTNLFLFIFCQRKRREHVYVCLCKRMKCNYHSEKRKKPKKEMQLVFKNNKCRWPILQKIQTFLETYWELIYWSLSFQNLFRMRNIFHTCNALAVHNYLSCPIEMWVIKRSILRPQLN